MASKLIQKIHMFLRAAEIDRPTLFGILNSAKSVLLSPITPLLITSRFTREIQGFYYTFASVLAFQVFVEMGLGQVIVQFASHEWANLSLDRSRRIIGSESSLSRLVSLGVIAFRWYGMGSILVVVILGTGGYFFFLHSLVWNVHWRMAWFALCLVTGIRLLFIPAWSILEGCNQVSSLYMSRFIEGILNMLTVWVAIISGAKLFTAAFSSLAIIVWNLFFLSIWYGRFFRPFFKPITGPRIKWKKEIWPMQSRIAVSWLSGYFCVSIFIPVLFHYQGAIISGQMGLTWSAITVLISVSGLWLSTKVPRFGALIAKRNFDTLDRLLFRCMAFSTMVFATGALCLWSGTYILYAIHHRLAERILSPLPTGLFLIGLFVMEITAPLSAYLRAHKREPLVYMSAVSGLLTGFSTWYFGSRYGAVGIALGYLAIALFVVLPWEIILWNRCRREWHAFPSRQSLGPQPQITPPAPELLMVESQIS